MNRKVLYSLPLVLAWSAPAWSAELYRYVNEDGVVVLDSQIPPKYVGSGYTVLSPDGRVIRVVERVLSGAEKVERERQLAEEKLREEQQAARVAADATLMRLYSKPEDVLRARDTKIATIVSFLDSARGTLERLKAQKKVYEAQAAQVERAGGIVTKENLAAISSVVERIQQTQLEIEHKQTEITDLSLAYDRDLARVKELYGLP